MASARSARVVIQERGRGASSQTEASSQTAMAMARGTMGVLDRILDFGFWILDLEWEESPGARPRQRIREGPPSLRFGAAGRGRGRLGSVGLSDSRSKR